MAYLLVGLSAKWRPVQYVVDLLDVPRISQGKINLRKESVELTSVVERAVQVVAPLVRDKDLELTISLPTGPLPLEADPTRLEQILVNLLNNAAKYTDRGGQIAVSARREGEELCVTVRDTGIGIDAKMLTQVFNLFTQVDDSLDRSRGGLGIGLTLVRRLAELHGGSVQARSEGLGKGSEFTVRFPAAEAPPQAKVQGTEHPRSRLPAEAGFDHHLVKPIDHEALLAVLGPSPRRPQP